MTDGWNLNALGIVNKLLFNKLLFHPYSVGSSRASAGPSLCAHTSCSTVYWRILTHADMCCDLCCVAVRPHLLLHRRIHLQPSPKSLDAVLQKTLQPQLVPWWEHPSLVYADVCWRMLTYAVCWRMLTYAAVTFTGWGLGFSPLLLVLIDLISGFLGLIIKDFGNQTESWAWLWSPLIITLFEILDDNHDYFV